MSALGETAKTVAALEKCKYGFVTDIEMEKAAKGLNEDIVRFISAKKNEPEWMLEWRLAAFRRWKEMEEPSWARVHYAKIDYQNASYYAAPKQTVMPASLEEVDNFCLPSGKVLTKVNPLATWTNAEVWRYLRENQIPVLPLYDLGYTSIGCQPCTEPPPDPDNPRSGRWGGRKLECGIHIQAQNG